MLRSTIKYAYKQKVNKIHAIVIAKNAKEIYKNETESVSKIRTLVYKMNFIDYEEYWNNKILIKFYQSNCHIDSIVRYMKKYHNISLTSQSIVLRMNRRGISRLTHIVKRKKITKKDELEIIKKYNNGATSTELCVEYGYATHKSILDILHNYNVKPRTQDEVNAINVKSYDFNFNVIDSEFKAYYIGILLTDGYINSSRNNVSVQMCDKDVIEFINENTKGNMIEIKKKNKNHKTMYRTSIYNSAYKEQLKRFSITEQKSLILKGPQLFREEKQFIRYIIRGIIDGDGWIRKDGKEFFICSASYDFTQWCKESLEVLGMTELKIKFKDNNHNGIYYIRSAKYNNIEILKQIYNKPFGMMRKYSLLKK